MSNRLQELKGVNKKVRAGNKPGSVEGNHSSRIVVTNYL